MDGHQISSFKIIRRLSPSFSGSEYNISYDRAFKIAVNGYKLHIFVKLKKVEYYYLKIDRCEASVCQLLLRQTAPRSANW